MLQTNSTHVMVMSQRLRLQSLILWRGMQSNAMDNSMYLICWRVITQAFCGDLHWFGPTAVIARCIQLLQTEKGQLNSSGASFYSSPSWFYSYHHPCIRWYWEVLYPCREMCGFQEVRLSSLYWACVCNWGWIIATTVTTASQVFHLATWSIQDLRLETRIRCVHGWSRQALWISQDFADRKKAKDTQFAS